MRDATLHERLMSRLMETEDGCLVFVGSNAGGYGQLSVNGRNQRAHRVAWELEHGPIPPGLHVLHYCDNPPCCRVSHLYLGTDMDNTRDKLSRGRAATGDRNGARTHPERWVRGEENYKTTLTTDQVRAIRSRFALGNITRAELANEYGVHLKTIGNITRRATWRHVE